MNIFRRLRLYRDYKKAIKSNKVALEANFNVRIDNANRMYTVINIPEENFQEPYNLRTGDIDIISQQFVREYINALSNYLNNIGIPEMYDFYEPIKKVGKYSYLVVLGYKFMDSLEYNNLVWLRIVPISAGVSLISIILYLIFG
jgi:hypothetical protein